MENKLNWEAFAPKFHESWYKFMKDIIESPEVFEIYKYLKERSRLGHRTLPDSSNTFRAFTMDYNKLKVIMVGMEPYASVHSNIIVADGYCFSCSNTHKGQKSLLKLMEGLESDTGQKFSKCFDFDLSYLKDEGILLTNYSLTVEKDKISSHTDKDLWEPFWELLISKVFNQYNPGLIWLLLGKQAQKLEKYILPFNNHVFTCNHPSFFARTESEFQTNNIFKKTNEILKQNNGVEAQINWVWDLPYSYSEIPKESKQRIGLTISEDSVPF